MNEINAAKVRAYFDARPAKCEAAGVIIDAGDWWQCHQTLIENFEYELETGELHENLRWDAYLGLPSAKRDAKVIIDNYRQSLGRGWNGLEDRKALSRLLDEAGLY